MANDKEGISQYPATFDELFVKASTEKLYEKLILQLNKDFLLSNIDIEFRISITPLELKQELHEAIFNLIQTKFLDYLNLLYIIDISESKIKNLDGSDMHKMSSQVAFLIVLREWKKVWFKHTYS